MKKEDKEKLLKDFVLVGLISMLGIFIYLSGVNPFFTLLVVFFGVYFIYYARPQIDFKETLEQLFLLILGFALVFSGYKFIVPRFNLGILSLPIMAFGMFSCLLFERLSVALIINLLLSLFLASLTQNFTLFYVIFIPSMAGTMLVYKTRHRVQIIKAAFFASVFQFFLDLFLNMPFDMNWQEVKVLLFSNLGNGVLSFVLVSGLLPVFEHFFGLVTNIRLLELSDFNHPILRKMILEAPGTYQHSILVANLSEVAAEKIGANSLLARVGAYFHDIGKTSKAEYFIENQLQSSDKHGVLNPSMSKLVIINHVKEGVEVAKKYRLPPPIIDFIPQHHGTSVISYFYYQASQNVSGEEKEKLKEEFRYTGPKPQSREAAIVLLADSVEAASRVLADPSPSRIEDLVDEIVDEKVADGQLDDSSLELKDLRIIKSVFTRILNAMYHARVEYPEGNSQRPASRKKDESNHRKPKEEKSPPSKS